MKGYKFGKTLSVIGTGALMALILWNYLSAKNSMTARERQLSSQLVAVERRMENHDAELRRVAQNRDRLTGQLAKLEETQDDLKEKEGKRQPTKDSSTGEEDLPLGKEMLKQMLREEMTDAISGSFTKYYAPFLATQNWPEERATTFKELITKSRQKRLDLDWLILTNFHQMSFPEFEEIISRQSAVAQAEEEAVKKFLTESEIKDWERLKDRNNRHFQSFERFLRQEGLPLTDTQEGPALDAFKSFSYPKPSPKESYQLLKDNDSIPSSQDSGRYWESVGGKLEPLLQAGQFDALKKFRSRIEAENRTEIESTRNVIKMLKQ